MSAKFTATQAAEKIGCSVATISRHLPRNVARIGGIVQLTLSQVRHIATVVRPRTMNKR
jgi:hypothetical protein